MCNVSPKLKQSETKRNTLKQQIKIQFIFRLSRGGLLLLLLLLLLVKC
jgi:hypothetical protein